MKRNLPIILVLIFCFVFRVMLTPYGTFEPDLGTFVDWSNRVNKMGFSGFYSEWSDYLPGYIYVLWFLGKVRVMLPPTFTNELLYKLPSIITDVITIYLIYLLVLEFKNRRWAITGAFIYGISPSVFGDSALWGQVDSFSTLPVVLLFCFVLRCNLNKGYTLLAGLFLGAAAVLKPTGVLLGPLFITAIILNGRGNRAPTLKNILLFLVPAVAVFLLAFVPFLGEKNFFPFVIERVQKSINQHSATCLNSYNFWMIIEGCWKDASAIFLNFSLRQWGVGLFAGVYSLVILKITNYQLPITKQKIMSLRGISVTKQSRGEIVETTGLPRFARNDTFLLILGSAVIFLSGFLFLTGMHERHIFPMFAFLAIASVFRPKLWIAYLIMTGISSLNLIYAQAWFAGLREGIYGKEYTNFFSLIMVISWVYLMIEYMRGKAVEKA